MKGTASSVQMRKRSNDFSRVVRTLFPSPVPEGRLNVAQDVSPGYACAMEKSRRDDWKTIEPYPGFRERTENSSRPCGTFRCSNLYPGLTSWAKFRRPCGTELRGEVLRQNRIHSSDFRSKIRAVNTTPVSLLCSVSGKASTFHTHSSPFRGKFNNPRYVRSM